MTTPSFGATTSATNPHAKNRIDPRSDRASESSDVRFYQKLESIPRSRWARLASIREEIRSGRYLTEEKLLSAMTRALCDMGR